MGIKFTYLARALQQDAILDGSEVLTRVVTFGAVRGLHTWTGTYNGTALILMFPP